MGKVWTRGAFPCGSKAFVSTEEQPKGSKLVLLHVKLCEEELITDFPSSCKNWKNKFFFAGRNWYPAIHSLGGDIHLPTRFVTPGRLFFYIFHFSDCYLLGSLTLFILSESWGLIKNLDD